MRRARQPKRPTPAQRNVLELMRAGWELIVDPDDCVVLRKALAERPVHDRTFLSLRRHWWVLWNLSSENQQRSYFLTRAGRAALRELEQREQ